MPKNSDMDKIIATASSALTKREELLKIISEKDELLMKIEKREFNEEELVDLLDKSLILSKKLLTYGIGEDALYLLSNIVALSHKFGVKELFEKAHEEIKKILKVLINEALNWNNFDQAILFAIMIDILENYAQTIDDKLDNLLLKVDENLELAKKELVDIRNDITSLLLNLSSEAIEEIKNRLEKLEIKSNKIIKAIIKLLEGLSTNE